ncbi:MAG: transposase [Fibrobacterota bacterium]
MKKRFTEVQIIRILQEVDSGTSTSEVARQYGIHQNTIYNWRSKYGGMEPSDIQKMKLLEEDNNRLKRLVADLSLDNQVLKDVNSKNW